MNERLNELHARLQAAYRIRDFELVKRLTREYREAASGEACTNGTDRK